MGVCKSPSAVALLVVALVFVARNRTALETLRRIRLVSGIQSLMEGIEQKLLSRTLPIPVVKVRQISGGLLQ